MLLRRLCEHAGRDESPPAFYATAPVRYVIELDAAGRLTSPRPVDTADPAHAATRNGTRMLVPRVQRSSAVRPLLLADKADYTLGLVPEGARPGRVAACHDAYLALLERCAAQTGEPAVQAVLAFLRRDPLGELALPEDFDPGASIAFRVDGVQPVDLPTVRAFWAATHAPGAGGAAVPTMQCLVCGRERPVLERLKGKLKGVPGGQTSGTAIISANAEAFLSYGLEASLVAPTCAECGERFTTALNRLLADRSTRIDLGGVAYVFWTREDTGFGWADWLSDPKPDEVRALLESVRRGRRPAPVDEAAFHAVGLSGSGGRAVVRDWIDTTIGAVRERLAAWFAAQAITGARGEDPEPLGLFALARATVREARDLAPLTPRSLLRAALIGERPPPALLAQAVRRARAEQGVTRPRAALIKLVLVSRDPASKEDTMVRLDPDHPNPAYHCGRLLAVLEAVQRAAMPGVNQTIVDRFYGTASAAPASVFPRLIRGAQPHLARLERDRRGAYVALQRRLEEILGRLDGFPSTLALEGQGLFALGYYHQRAHDRAQAGEARQRRAADDAPDAATDSTPTEEVD